MVAPMTKREVYEETVKYCDRILEILKDWEPSNDTPPGRVIFEGNSYPFRTKSGRISS